MNRFKLAAAAATTAAAARAAAQFLTGPHRAAPSGQPFRIPVTATDSELVELEVTLRPAGAPGTVAHWQARPGAAGALPFPCPEDPHHQQTHF